LLGLTVRQNSKTTVETVETVETGANNMQTLFDWLVAATFGIALGCVLFFFL
jgi:hypothetical protein